MRGVVVLIWVLTMITVTVRAILSFELDAGTKTALSSMSITPACLSLKTGAAWQTKWRYHLRERQTDSCDPRAWHHRCATMKPTHTMPL